MLPVNVRRKVGSRKVCLGTYVCSDKPRFGASNADGDATTQTFDSDHGQAIMPVIDLQYPAALIMSNSQSDVQVSQ